MPIGSFRLNTLSAAIQEAITYSEEYAGFIYDAYPKLNVLKTETSGNVLSLQGNQMPSPGSSYGRVSVTADGVYMAYSISDGPYCIIYKKISGVWTFLTSINAGNSIYAVRFSPNGNYLLVSGGSSVSCYSRSGDTFTALTLSGTAPTNTVYNACWAPDSSAFALAAAVTPFLFVYTISGSTATRTANPATLPPGNGFSVSWSPDGTKIAIGCSVAPYFAWYSYSGGTLTALTNPVTALTAVPQDMKWSPDGSKLVAINSTSPYIQYWTLSGSTLTKTALTIGTTPGSQTYGIEWLGDSATLAVASYSTSPYIFFYTLSGTTLTKTSNPATLPLTGGVFDVCWSPSDSTVYCLTSNQPTIFSYVRSGSTFTYSEVSQRPQMTSASADYASVLGEGAIYEAKLNPSATHIAVCSPSASTPYIRFFSFNRTTNTATKLANPASLPTSSSTSVGWNPTGDVVVFGHTATPYISAYSRSGDTFTKLTNPATIPTAAPVTIQWSPTGSSFAMAFSTSVRIYNYSGGTFTVAATLTPGGTIIDVDWNHDGSSIAITVGVTSPYVHIYNRTVDTFTKLSNLSTLPSSAQYVSWSHDGSMLAVSGTVSSVALGIYIRSGDTFTKITGPSGLPATGSQVAFNKSGNKLLLNIPTEGKFYIYNYTGTSFTLNQTIISGGVVRGTYSNKINWVKPV